MPLTAAVFVRHANVFATKIVRMSGSRHATSNTADADRLVKMGASTRASWPSTAADHAHRARASMTAIALTARRRLAPN